MVVGFLFVLFLGISLIMLYKNKAVACFTLVISGLFKSVYAHCWSSFLENVRTTVTNIGQCITIVYVFQNVSDEGIKKTTLPTFLKLGHKRKYIIKTDKVGKHSTMTGMASVHYIKTTRGCTKKKKSSQNRTRNQNIAWERYISVFKRILKKKHIAFDSLNFF